MRYIPQAWEKEEARIRTMQDILRKMHKQELDMPAVQKALIVLLMSRGNRLVRDNKQRWNHVDVPRGTLPPVVRKGVVIAEAQPDLGPFQELSFSFNTVNRLIDAGYARPTLFNGNGSPLEIVWTRL